MINQDVINKGRLAKQLLESEAFKVIVDGLKRDACEAWMQTAPDAKDAREDLYYMQVALAHIQTKLTGMSDNGRIEQMKAEQEEARQQVTAKPAVE